MDFRITCGCILNDSSIPDNTVTLDKTEAVIQVFSLIVLSNFLIIQTIGLS